MTVAADEAGLMDTPAAGTKVDARQHTKAKGGHRNRTIQENQVSHTSDSERLVHTRDKPQDKRAPAALMTTQSPSTAAPPPPSARSRSRQVIRLHESTPTIRSQRRPNCLPTYPLPQPPPTTHTPLHASMPRTPPPPSHLRIARHHPTPPSTRSNSGTTHPAGRPTHPPHHQLHPTSPPHPRKGLRHKN